MTNKNPIYLAIDSDVLRTLTLLDILKKEHGYVDIDKIKDSSLKKDFNYFNRLYNALNHDEIRPLIVDAFNKVLWGHTTIEEVRRKLTF